MKHVTHMTHMKNIYTAKQIHSGQTITRYCHPFLQRKMLESSQTILDDLYNQKSQKKAILITGLYEPFIIGYVNDRFVELFGWPKEEVIGRTLRMLQGPSTDHVINTNQEAICRYSPLSQFPHVTLNHNSHRDGRELYCRVSVIPKYESAYEGFVTSIEKCNKLPANPA